MKKIALIGLMAFISAATFSQDLIVTTSNDSLNCKISKVEENFIRFAYNQNGEAKNTIISQDQVASYQISYFEVSDLPVTSNSLQKERVKAQVGFHGGYSWMTGALNGYDQIRGLKHGGNLGLDIAGFFNKFIGLGLRTTYYRNSVSAEHIFDMNNYVETQNAVFISPNLVFRVIGHSKKDAFVGNVAMGYFGWFSEFGERNQRLMTVDRHTVGFLYGVGYERVVSRDLSIGGRLSLLAANFGEEHGNASRIDLSIFVVLNTYKK